MTTGNHRRPGYEESASHLGEGEDVAWRKQPVGKWAQELAQRGQASGPFDAAGTWRQLQSRLDRERGARARLRAWPTWARVATALAGVGVIYAAQYLLTRRADFAVYPGQVMVSIMAVGSAVLLLAVLVVLRPVHVPEPSVKKVTLLGVALVALPWLQAFGPVHVAHPESLAGAGEDFVARAAGCFVYGSLMSAPLLVYSWLAHRRDQPPGWSAWLAALMAGVFANLTLQLHCPITHPGHLLAGHASIGLGWLAAVVLARRVGARRRTV